MGKSLKGKELGKGIVQRKDGSYMARFTEQGKTHTIYGKNLNELKSIIKYSRDFCIEST